MRMYNLLEHSADSITSGSLRNYYKDEVIDAFIDANENNADNYRIENRETVISELFDSKTKIIRSTAADNNTFQTEASVLLKHLSDFWRYLDFPLVNCELNLYFSWSKECIISEISKTAAVAANPINPAEPAMATNCTTLQTNSTKLYVPVVTLSMNNNIKFLENLKQQFKRTISWNVDLKQYRE